VFDESLGELFSISDPGFQGYALAARALRDRGYQVSTNLGPLEALVSGVGPVDGQVLIVALPTQPPTPRAAAAVRDFVQRGGGLLLLAEHDGIYGNAASLNALLEGWPIAVESGQAPSVVRPDLSPGPVTVVPSPAFDLDSVVLYLAAPLRREPGAAVAVVAGHSREGVGLGARVGRGRIAVVGDAEWPWNGTPSLGLRAGRNLAFLRQLVEWLSRPSIAGPDDGVAPNSTRPDSRPAIAALADRDGRPFGDGPDEYGALLAALRHAGFATVVTADSAAVAGAGAVLVAGPAVPLPKAVRGRPIVALLHATSGPPPPWGPSGAATADHPAATLLGLAGVEPQVGLLRDTGTPTGACPWHRSALLRTTAQDAIVHMWAAPTSVAVLDLMPLVTPARSAARSPPPPPHGRWPLVVETPRALVFASGSVLANAATGTACSTRMTRLLTQWLERVAPERARVP
jgi:hypothetical protein